MVTTTATRQLALSFPEAVELPHFELTSFRVNKKIFATLDVKRKRLCVLLKPVDQSVFCLHDLAIIYPVPNKWGKNGATYVELSTVRKSILKDILTVAYCSKAPSSLADKYNR